MGTHGLFGRKNTHMNHSSRQVHIEFLRIVAAFLVIVNHTNSRIFLARAPSATWFASVTYFFICKIAVPLFLMIMGALLLEKHDTHQSPFLQAYFCANSLAEAR